MSWNKEGQSVIGVYLDMFTVKGKVISSRVKYGGKVQHTVEVDVPIMVYGKPRDTFLLDEEELVAPIAFR